jgi:capsular polysaccharide export protein
LNRNLRLGGIVTEPVLAMPSALAVPVPLLAAFLPEWRLLPEAEVPATAACAWLDGAAGTPPTGRPLLTLSEGPWRAPRFGRRWAPLGLLPSLSGDPVTAALARPVPEGPDITALLPLAERLPACQALLVRSGLPPGQALARLLAASRFADPFRHRPWSAAEALAQLLDWQAAEATNRRIVAATGMEIFKRARMRERLASEAGPPRIFWRASAALRHAARQRSGGAIAVWSSAMPPGLPTRAAAAGVGLVQVEDGFIRSAGLGVQLAPACSLVLDGWGMHFDPSAPSELEQLLQTADFPPALLARAARLRAALLRDGITKYNLRGPAPAISIPPGRRVVLVCGQVEDDASLRRGGGVIRSNLALLRAARQESPDAFLIYKPHPDVETGIRAGTIRPQALVGLADHVAAHTPIAPLYALAEEVQVMSSLAGFEALLRGRRVVCHGQPFYAGWGLTEDRAPLPRRSRRLTLDELVAGALLLYPRCIHPLTGLPCPVEVLLERLPRLAPPAPPRAPDWLRHLVAWASGRFTLFWARR